MSRLHVISASTRPTSLGRSVARWITELATGNASFDTRLVDLGEVALPFLDEPEHPSERRYIHRHTKEWSVMTDAADAFVIVMPMYNGGFGAPLKNAIDFLYQEWQGKPVGLVSYSAGASGGAPAVEMIRPVLGRVGLRPAVTSLSIPGIEDRIEQDGRFDPLPEHEEGARAVLAEVAELLTAPQPLPA
ncbi:NADPH-dependent FMN reductase [Streptomyces sp. cmx-18-6]|uniref:NADPH-dependent FMN reductase n=1 Tax=Streptomyces sp. cmx-18-6 TaxID=2790930 RepID=UPI00397FF30A